ncbi:MAG: SPFH domain-containing protein, partial [Pirellulaceae bacterium]
DQAVVKTGMGPADVITAGGMLVFPVINQVQSLSLKWQPVEIEFNDAAPLCFASGTQSNCMVTAWVSLDTTGPAIIEAAQSLGDRNDDPDLVKQLYQDSMRQAITRFAAGIELVSLQESLPEIPSDLMKALSQDVESFHQLHRVTIAIEP